MFFCFAQCGRQPDSGQSSPDFTASGDSAEKRPATADEPLSAAAPKGPGRFLPARLDGFEPSSPPRYFNAENLFDLIDGGAEIYIAFGLKEMVTADYRPTGRTAIAITVEIYDMGSVEGAFGRMARFLSGRTEIRDAGKGLPEAIAGQGIFDGSDAVFCRGSYLVHLALLDESPEATPESMVRAGRDILPVFARAIAERIGAVRSMPERFDAFPAEGREPRGETWEPADVAGIEGLGPGYAVRYGDGGRRWTLLVARATGDAADWIRRHPAVSGDKAGQNRPVFGKAGDWVIGFLPEAGRWTGKDIGLPAAQIEALKSSLETRSWR